MNIDGDVRIYSYFSEEREVNELQDLYDKIVSDLMLHVARRVQNLFYQNLHRLQETAKNSFNREIIQLNRPTASDFIQNENAIVKQMFADINHGAIKLLNNTLPRYSSSLTPDLFDSMIMQTLEQHYGISVTNRIIEAITFDVMIQSNAIKL